MVSSGWAGARALLVAAALVWVAPAVSAQPESSALTQNLSWTPVDYASAYRLEIRAGDQLVFDRTGPVTSHRVALAAGFYQWRLTVYNLLGHVETVGSWQDLTVHKAVRPEIRRVRPGRLTAGRAAELRLEGSGLSPQTRILLISEDGTARALAQGTPGGLDSLAVGVGADVVSGRYTIRVQNPGGLEAEAPLRLVVEPAPWFHWSAAAGWAGTLPLADSWYTSTWNQRFYPRGATSRVGLALSQPWVVVPGLRLGAAWFQAAGSPEGTRFQSDFRRADLQLTVGRVWQPWAWEAGVGGGLTWTYFRTEGKDFTSAASINPTATAFLEGRLELVPGVALAAGVTVSDVFLGSQQALSLQPEAAVRWSF